MRISNNYTNKVSFGYDKKLDRELKTELFKIKDKDFAKAMLKLNSQCNTIEDSLRKMENNGKEVSNPSTFADLSDIFVALKSMLCEYVSIMFVDNKKLDYANRIHDYYSDDFADETIRRLDDKDKPTLNSYNWRNLLLDGIMMHTSYVEPLEKTGGADNYAYYNDPDDEKDYKDYNKKSNADDEDIDEDELDEDDNSVHRTSNTKAGSKTTKGSLLQKYEPTPNSPKGFEDVVGLDDVKEVLNDGILKAIKSPETVKEDLNEYGITTPRGILLYGPPGCGKTYISKALAQEAGVPLYLLDVSKFGSAYINRTSKNLSKAFDEAIKIAKDTNKPILLFMDEIDTVAFNRKDNVNSEDLKMIGTLLQCLDKAEESNVFVIGATNKYNMLDPAVVRRITAKKAIGVPNQELIESLIKKNLGRITKGKTLLEDEEALKRISKELRGYSNDSVCKITQDAANIARKRNRSMIEENDFLQAIKKTGEVKPNPKDFLPSEDIKHSKIGFFPSEN